MIQQQAQPMSPFGTGTGQDDDEQARQLRMAMLAAQMGGQGQDQQQSPPPVQMPQQSPDLSPFQNQTHPAVTLAHASYADQPAASDVTSAQQHLDQFNDKPMWKRMLLPAIVGASSALAARSRNGAQAQQAINQDIQNYGQRQVGDRESLIKQLEFAKAQQQSQYEADQRNRQQDLLMQGNNQTRTLLGQLSAGAKRDVAQTTADSRRDVADTAADSRETVATGSNASREKVANIRGGFSVETAKISAQAAMSRFLAGEGRTDSRQQLGFEHSDNKPTADEDRRADLSEAMIGYAHMLGDIATRRPELLGPAAGRLTQLRQFVGTNDQDVANLKFLREQLGITQMGAHSLRSAQAIAPIADALVNGFHNGPEATLAAVAMAEKGVGSFTGPQTRIPVNSPARAPLKSRVAPTPQAGPEIWTRGADGKLVRKQGGQ